MGYEKQSILDNYELGGIVGEGSYGTVHKAKNKETGRYVAIKKFIEDDQTTLKIAHREVNPARVKRTRTSCSSSLKTSRLSSILFLATGPETITS